MNGTPIEMVADDVGRSSRSAPKGASPSPRRHAGSSVQPVPGSTGARQRGSSFTMTSEGTWQDCMTPWHS
jgi:hypothetical protein